MNSTFKSYNTLSQKKKIIEHTHTHKKDMNQSSPTNASLIVTPEHDVSIIILYEHLLDL